MIAYKDIPSYIKCCRDVKDVRNRASGWFPRKMLAEYTMAYRNGPLKIIRQDVYDAIQESVLINTAIYYILKKELLKKMSPLVSHRSDRMLAYGNKTLLEKYDRSLLTGDSKESDGYLSEIYSRLILEI